MSDPRTNTSRCRQSHYRQSNRSLASGQLADECRESRRQRVVMSPRGSRLPMLLYCFEGSFVLAPREPSRLQKLGCVSRADITPEVRSTHTFLNGCQAVIQARRDVEPCVGLGRRCILSTTRVVSKPHTESIPHRYTIGTCLMDF